MYNWILATDPGTGGGETMTEIFSGLSEFITGIFGGLGSVLTGITGQPVLLAFVILMPLMSIGIGLLMKFLGKKKGKKR